METLVYLPAITQARLVRNYFFKRPDLGPCSCVLVTDCKADSTPHYAHAFYVFAGGDFLTGRPCFAVASEINRTAEPDGDRSHFLGVFPGGPEHVNRGASNEWADLARFEAKALEIVMESFALTEPLRELPIPTMMAQRFRVPRTYSFDPDARPEPTKPEPPRANPTPPPQSRKWWEFWN